ncbi:MAG TPA: HDIG domain-containing metalloprotein [Candidatus Obscuribacterales bacterium]
MEPDTTEKHNPDPPHPSGIFIWWLLVALAGFIGLVLALGAPHIFGQPIRAGEVAERDLVCPVSTTITDEAQTRLAQQKARQAVLPVFKHDHEVDRLIVSRLKEKLESVRSLQVEVGVPLPSRLGLTPREQAYLIECPEEVWKRLLADGQRARTTMAAADPRQVSPGQQAVRPAIEAILHPKLETLLHPPAPQPHARQKRGPAPEPPRADPLAPIARARQSYQPLNASSPVPHEVLTLACSVEQADWPEVSATMERATRRLLQLGPLFPGMDRSDWEQTVIEFLPERWNERVRLTGARVIASVLEPNAVIDQEATRRKADAAAAAIAPIKRTVKAGDVLVRRGTIISADQVSLLASLGITHTSNWPMVISLSLSLLAAFALVGVFLYTYEPKHLFSPASIGLMCTVCVVTCGIAAFAGHQYPQFVPVPAAALVLTIFFGTRVALVMTVLIMIFLGTDGLIETNHLIALGTAACAAVGANIKQRRQLMIRGFLIGVLQVAGYTAAIILTQSGSSAAELGGEMALQFLGGLSSCIVAVGSLPFLENIFGMVTPFRLAELTDATQPLLRRLEENAPGTYQHSLAVANLAEAGARAIGADVNLVRAGALYHDIGKMVRPKYFIENQLGDRNPHDAMSPEESRDRVLAHVTDGLALARKYDLPKAVQDFIPQHQGTTLMAYFYHKACLRDGADKVDANFYRYPGPKPQSREAAIVMLADVSEAVTHSLKDPSQDEIEQAIGTVFKARWDDGQFTEAGLTAGELERVKKAFVRVWRTLHHERLKYPSTTTGRMPVPPEPPATTSLT